MHTFYHTDGQIARKNAYIPSTDGQIARTNAYVLSYGWSSCM